MSHPTPKQIDALPSISAAQMVKLLDLQIATIAMRGQAVDGDGRTLTRADIAKLQATRAYFADLAATDAAAANNDCGVVTGVLLPRFPNDA